MNVVSGAKAPEVTDLHRAAERLEGVAHRTPVMTSSQFDDITGARVFFKCECFQRMGAFKFRGAFNTVASLEPAERARGVVTHSSGNHGQAVALAAKLFDHTKAYVVVPKNAPQVKLQAMEGYGAEIVLCEPTMAERESGATQIIERTGAALIHPFDDPRVIAGQSTAARELIEQAGRPLDLILVPVGGGGLASGTALAARYFSPSTRVIGCEPAGADDACRSVELGRRVPVESPATIADGLRGQLSQLTFELIHKYVDQMVRVQEADIRAAMRWVWDRMKILIEPSAAVPVAALMAGQIEAGGKSVGIILSGGNVDIEAVIDHG